MGFGKLFRGEHLCKVYNLQTNTTILAKKVRGYKDIRYIHITYNIRDVISRGKLRFDLCDGGQNLPPLVGIGLRYLKI